MSKSLQKRPGDPRLGYLIRSSPNSNTKYALLGFPYDGGVKINFGRTGAALAPNIIRECLYKLTPEAANENNFLKTLNLSCDIGNLSLSKDINKAQAKLADTVASLLSKRIVPIIIGGGHETSYGHFLGYAKTRTDIGIINLDAHLDVRERVGGLPHSGSSFRDALLHPSRACTSYTAIGIQPHSCASKHLQFVQTRKNCNVIFANDCTSSTISKVFKNIQRNTLVTIDIDAIDQAYAPGASAPCTNGLRPEVALHFAYEAGRSKHVSSIDIVEVNPKYDRDSQTAKLAALIIWHFIRGLAKRS